MTGKEDLFTYEEVSRLAKRLEEETIETRCELTKYKRAFEIFRANDMNVKWLLDYERITQEEYELLEELMKDDN